MDCNPPGSSVHRILQARVLERIANSFSRGAFRWGLNLDHPHCRQILYHLSHQEAHGSVNWEVSTIYLQSQYLYLSDRMNRFDCSATSQSLFGSRFLKMHQGCWQLESLAGSEDATILILKLQIWDFVWTLCKAICYTKQKWFSLFFFPPFQIKGCRYKQKPGTRKTKILKYYITLCPLMIKQIHNIQAPEVFSVQQTNKAPSR